MITKARANRLRKYVRRIESTGIYYEKLLVAQAMKVANVDDAAVYSASNSHALAWAEFEGELRDCTERKEKA